MISEKNKNDADADELVAFVKPTLLFAHSMSYRKTYTERVLNVERERIVQQQLDPVYYLS